MAISTTYSKQQEQLNRQQQATGSKTPYTGMQGVSQNTANNLGNYQSGYKPGQQAQAAQDNLTAIQNNKPQTYSSKYGAQLDGLLKQIQNPGEFKYEFNGDNLFKYYADLYTQKGKQASMDAMGQAAALTGGYGNTYAQQAGQQQYQQYLMDLYDRGLDLRDRAYQNYQDQLGNQKDVYNLMNAAENQDYGRYRDTVSDWQNELQYATDRADAERNFDYNQYQNDLNYWTGLAEVENAAYNTEAERQEAIRQYEQNFAENQRQYDTSMAEDQRQYNESLAWDKEKQNQSVAEGYVNMMLQRGLMPSADLLMAAGLSQEDAQKFVMLLQQPGVVNVTGIQAPTVNYNPGTTTTDTNANQASVDLFNSMLQETAKKKLATVKPSGEKGGGSTKAINVNSKMNK